MGFVDCDSHVYEDDETWSYLDPAERIYLPLKIGEPFNGGLWLVGDTWGALRNMDTEPGPEVVKRRVGNVFDRDTVNMRNLGRRLEDLDALGIDVQLLISSFYIGTEIDHPIEEAALARSYNRWVAEHVEGYTDRLGWALRAPMWLHDRAFEELEFGKAHGAVGIHVRGIEHGYYLSDPYFYPIYERAEDLDLAMIVHVGSPHRRIDNGPIGKVVWTPGSFTTFIHTVMAGFAAVVGSDLHKRFPRLRWGFVEGGATWVPAVLQQHARLIASADDFLHLQPITPEQLEEKNIFVCCEADEDLGYLTKLLGENVLCVGTDYGHNDIGSELAAHATIMQRDDISEAVARKIVDTNGRKFLGLNWTKPEEVLTLADIPSELPHIFGAKTDDRHAVVSSAAV